MENKEYGVCPLIKSQCLGVECAWWHEVNSWCAVVDLAGSLGCIDYCMNEDALNVVVLE